MSIVNSSIISNVRGEHVLILLRVHNLNARHLPARHNQLLLHRHHARGGWDRNVWFEGAEQAAADLEADEGQLRDRHLGDTTGRWDMGSIWPKWEATAATSAGLANGSTRSPASVLRYSLRNCALPHLITASLVSADMTLLRRTAPAAGPPCAKANRNAGNCGTEGGGGRGGARVKGGVGGAGGHA
jgi:hypothetical protein